MLTYFQTGAGRSVRINRNSLTRNSIIFWIPKITKTQRYKEAQPSSVGTFTGNIGNVVPINLIDASFNDWLDAQLRTLRTKMEERDLQTIDDFGVSLKSKLNAEEYYQLSLVVNLKNAKNVPPPPPLSETSASETSGPEQLTTLTDGLEEENTQTQVTTGNQTRLLRNLTPPRLDIDQLTESIQKLKIFYKMVGSNMHIREIILAFLGPSKLHLLTNATNANLTTIDNFCIFLEESLGVQPIANRLQSFRCIRQRIDENVSELLIRLKRCYTSIHGNKPLSAGDEEILVHQYIKSLANKDVAKQLRIESPALKTIVQRSRQLESAFDQIDAQ